MRFHLRGLTLKIHPSFWFALLVVLGAMGPGRLSGLPRLISEVLAVVLVRELAQAATLGARPRILLSWMGGHTAAARPISLARQFLVFAAGPLATLLLSLIAEKLGLGRLATLARGWTLISLLPIQPHPGGRMTAALFAVLFPPRAARIWADVSSMMLSLVCFLAVITRNNPLVALLIVTISFPISVARLFDERRRRQHEAIRLQAWEQLRAGDIDESERSLGLLPIELDDDALRGAIDLVRERFGAALGPLTDAFEAHPSDETASYLARALIGLQRLDEATRLLEEPVAGRHLFHHVMAALFYAGRYPEAARVGERSWAVKEQPLTAFNLACTRARMNEPELAISWLARALDAGWRDLQQLDEDPDLALLRARAEWTPLRARLTSLGRN